MNSAELASSFINAGFKAILTCVDSFAMDGVFAGRLYDREFLSELPEEVDPAGKMVNFTPLYLTGPCSVSRYGFKKAKLS
jgi:diphthamide synthase (EF-2-diphthine--ammonia ligase)